mmetsp:Transcript_7866/g.13031  ORF Transcript_7866/g.13031 Transcript_7866/m.13031 type:complete len:304 (+) Transcript_7866:47-958(+)
MSLSVAEKQYISIGCNVGIRVDGRESDRYRSICVEDNIFPHVNGSSRVQIGSETDVICSIKFEAEEVQNNCESFTVSVDLSRSNRVRFDDQYVQSMGMVTSERLRSLLLGLPCFDSDKFTIIPHKFHWVAHIDILVLSMDGHPIDACSLSILVALRGATIPRTEPLVGESGLIDDFEIIGDLGEGICVDAASVPCYVSISKVGSSLLLDSSFCEQQCASCIISIAVDEKGNCCGVNYLKPGQFSCLEFSACITKACAVAINLHEHLRQYSERLQQGSKGSKEFIPSPAQHFPDIPVDRVGLLL